jgi:glycosyltransferase involved in cell wall biosynthesis
VHDTFDTRIFYKQIASLRQHFRVWYFSPTAGAPAEDWIVPLRHSRSKLGRIRTQLSLLAQLRHRKADLYLLHDPELLPLGIALRCLGKRVVWDMHEDTYNDIKTKGYLSPPVRALASFVYRIVQSAAYRILNGFILAEDKYGDYFPGSRKTCVVHNYPMLDRLAAHESSAKQPSTLVYIGSISSNRGVYQLIEIVEHLRQRVPDVRLVLIGPFTADSLERDVRERITAAGLEPHVEILGKMKNVEAYPVVARCMIGLALLLPEPNFAKSLPTKMFEYMALGLPVVVSDFPLWKAIVDEHDAGAAVDPLRPESAAEAIHGMLTDTARYAQLSGNAVRAASRYSWETESRTLVGFLSSMLRH